MRATARHQPAEEDFPLFISSTQINHHIQASNATTTTVACLPIANERKQQQEV
jgi:hypothetical protein